MLSIVYKIHEKLNFDHFWQNIWPRGGGGGGDTILNSKSNFNEQNTSSWEFNGNGLQNKRKLTFELILGVFSVSKRTEKYGPCMPIFYSLLKADPVSLNNKFHVNPAETFAK